MARPYVPDTGDIVWISFRPQAEHESAGQRPEVGLSPAAYNAQTSLMVCCPMTTHIKSYPFEVVVAGESPSAVLAAQDNIAVRAGGSTRENSGLDGSNIITNLSGLRTSP